MAEKFAARVERVDWLTKFWVPHEQGEIAFVFPHIGFCHDNYRNAGKALLEKNFRVPIGDYIASLLHAAYCLEVSGDLGLVGSLPILMKQNWLWVFNKNFWTSEGVYVVQDLEAKGRIGRPVSRCKLEKMLKDGEEVCGIKFSKDRQVRFAPKETYKLGEHTPESLSQDGFVVASYGAEGARKLAEVSSKLKYGPITEGLDIQDGAQRKLRVSTISMIASMTTSDRKLNVSGNWVGKYNGHAFGLL